MAAKILVIEDHLETRDVTTIWLERSGYKVIVANDGKEGLAKVQAERPDLIITDILMPTLNGIEVIERIRNLPGEGAVPIIAMTAFPAERAKEAIIAGADRAIGKPIGLEALLFNIKALLRPKSYSAN
jgi:CheY-like chemotaxis protein